MGVLARWWADRAEGSSLGAGGCRGRRHSAAATRSEDAVLVLELSTSRDLRFAAPELQDDEEACN